MYNIKPTCLFESHVILEIKKTEEGTHHPIGGLRVMLF